MTQFSRWGRLRPERRSQRRRPGRAPRALCARASAHAGWNSKDTRTVRPPVRQPRSSSPRLN